MRATAVVTGALVVASLVLAASEPAHAGPICISDLAHALTVKTKWRNAGNRFRTVRVRLVELTTTERMRARFFLVGTDVTSILRHDEALTFTNLAPGATPPALAIVFENRGDDTQSATTRLVGAFGNRRAPQCDSVGARADGSAVETKPADASEQP